MRIFALLSVGPLICGLSLPCAAEVERNIIFSPHLVYFHKDREYPSAFLWSILYGEGEIPPELREYPKQGDSFGYRIYKHNKIAEEVSGVIKGETLELSNGARIPTADKTNFDIIHSIHRVRQILLSPNIGN